MKFFPLKLLVSITVSISFQPTLAKAMEKDKSEIFKSNIKSAPPSDVPYPYLPIDSTMREKRVFITQGTYLAFEENFDKIFILGPLSPCIGIIARHSSNSGIVAHLDFTSNLESILAEMNKIGVNEPKNWNITLYTNTVDDYEYKFRSVYEGREQVEELKRIKDQFVNALNLERSQVRAIKFTQSKENIDLKEFAFIYHYLAVDRTGEIFTAAPIKDDLFKFRDNGHIPASLPITDQIKLTVKYFQDAFRNRAENLHAYRCKKYKAEEIITRPQYYGKFPLIELAEWQSIEEKN